MNFLRKSYCLLRRDKVFHINSCQFICNLSHMRSTVCRLRPSKGHFGNRLGQLLLWTTSGQRPRFQPRPSPRPRCMSNSIPGLGLGQFDPENCEESESNSSIITRPKPSQKNFEKESHDGMINKRLKELKFQVESGYFVTRAQVAATMDLVCQEICSDHQAALDLGLVMIRCCGHIMSSELPNERLQLAHHIVSRLQQLGLTMTVEHYNELLMCYIENRHRMDPSRFLETMSATPNKETFHLLLRCAGDLEQALEVIQRMKDGGIAISESVFNALVYLHAQTGDVASAQSVFETMQSAQLSPSSHTYTDLLRGLAECGDLAQMQRTFQEANAAGAAPSQSQVLSVVRSLAVTGHDASIPAVLPWLPELLDADAVTSLKTILRHFVRLGLGDAVTVLLNKLPVEEDRPFGLFVLQDIVKADWPLKTILSMCDLVSDRNPLALSQATFAALRAVNTDLALALFEAMKEAGDPIRAHYYWPLLIAARAKGEQELFRLVKHSRRMEVEMDETTLSTYVLKFVSLEAPEALLQRLQDLGFTLSQILSPLHCALISTRRLEAARHLCQVHPKQMDCEVLIPVLVTALMSGSEASSVVELLKLFAQTCQQADDWVGRFLLELLSRQRGLIPVDNQMEIIIKCLSDAGLRCSHQTVELISRQISGRQSRGERGWYATLTSLVDPMQTSVPDDRLSYYMRHPRTMSLEELNCHLGELKAKKMNTRGVLRLLLMKNCQLGNTKGVLEAKEELEKAGHNFSQGMKSALLHFYVKTGEVDKAKPMYEELSHDDNFVLDDYKAIKLATLLVTQNNIEEAIMVLDKASKQRAKGVLNLDMISQDCRTLLLATSREGQPDDTRLMFDTLVELGYCTISTKLLGPLIRTYLLRDDIEGAIQEFVSCVTKYNMTPLHYELMCHLIRKASDQTGGRKLSTDRVKELTEKVLRSTMVVHPHNNVKMNYLMALADVGDIKLLEQFVKESAKKINYEIFMKHVARLVKLDKPDAIKNLIEVFGRDKAFNLAPLFTCLLQIHCRHGDVQGALALWRRIHKMARRPNSSFLVVFRSLLESHNVPFPSFQHDETAVVVPTKGDIG